MSPVIRPLPTIPPSRLVRRFPTGTGRISTIGSPNRVMRIGARVFRTRSRISQHLERNTEIDTDFMA
jgi:hypothetical protein